MQSQAITKISQVTPSVTLFLRGLGLSNHYIIKIFDLVGDAAVALTEDDPYWLLEEFPRMGFEKVDTIAGIFGIGKDDIKRLRSGVSYVMKRYAAEGHSFVPKDELAHEAAAMLEVPSETVADVLEDMSFEGRIQISKVAGCQSVYFYQYYKAECGIAGKLAALAEPERGLKPVAADINAIVRRCESQSGIKLTEEQYEAVIGALSNGVSVITGGPGTGKTTVINTLINILEQSGFKTCVCAPTGRAAKRVMETSGHYAMTVHRLLEYSFDERSGRMMFGRDSSEPLNCGAVIVDESSMLDLMLTEALLDALVPGTRLILIGDCDQLPSVGAGNVLRDIIDSECFYTAILTEIHRQSAESCIISNAHTINKGGYPEYSGDFELILHEKQQEILENIKKIVEKLPKMETQVLTPYKKGIVGSINLNAELRDIYNPPADDKAELAFGAVTYRVGDRVMQIKNDYKIEYRYFAGAGTSFVNANGAASPSLHSEKAEPTETGRGVFNGEIGVIRGINTEERTVTVLYDDERWVEYPYVSLDEIVLAYAITVHKSQGSEFPSVIIPMTWFPPKLATRSLIYTAVTRAKKHVYIVGKPQYLNGMVDNNTVDSRNSGLCERIRGLYAEI